MTAIKAAFGGRIPLVYLDKGTSIPLSFVFQLPHKLRPSYVRDSLSKTMVLDHILDLQTFDAYDLVLTYDLSREFVLIVASPISYLGMETSHLETGFRSVLTAFFLLGKPSLSFGQLLLILDKEFRVAKGMPIARDDHALESQVKPDLLVDHWQRGDIFLNQERDEVAVSTIFGDGDTAGLASFGQGTRPVNIKRRIHLGKGQVRSIPLESRRGIGSRLWSVFLLESGVVRTSLKKIEESSIKVPQALLQRNRRNFIEPDMVILLFQQGQSLAHLLIVQTFPFLVIGVGSFAQRPIVDVATTTESVSKHLLLLISGAYSVLVGFLLFHILQYSAYAVSCQGSLSPCPSRPRRATPLISPWLKPGVLRGGSINVAPQGATTC